MGEITKDEIRERMGNVELIRDIIFGSKLQEYDSHLDKLDSNLSLLEKDIGDRLEQVKTELLSELRSSVESLEEKIKSLSITYQKDTADLQQIVNSTYKSFSSSLESLDRTVVTQTASIRKELLETRENLQEDTRTLKSQIFDELEKRFLMLSDSKVSRNDMAEILFEVGLKIKKTELAPELKEAVRNHGLDDALLIEASKVSE